MSLEEFDDPRLGFVFDYLNLATGKLAKSKEETNTINKILEFFENQSENMMIIIPSPSGVMEVYKQFPAEMKSNAYYFVKNQPASYDKQTDMKLLQSEIACGDLHKSPLHHFTAFVNSVLAPFVLNEKNREGWPESLSQGIKRDLHNLQKKSDIVLEKIQGRTHLPYPINLDKLISGQIPISAR